MRAAAEALVLAHLHLVAPIARALRQILPYTIDREDLEAQGRIGLVMAARSYNPRRSPRVPFSLWAHYKIRAAIIDAHKGRNFVWDSSRYQLRGALRQDNESGPCAWSGAVGGGYADRGAFMPYEGQADPVPSPDAAILHGERKQLVARAAVRVLTSRERATLERVARGWRMAAIGRKLHVTESAVCRIRDRAIAKVRAYLGGIVDHGRGAGGPVAGL